MSADRVGFRCSMCGKLHRTQRERDDCEAKQKNAALVEKPTPTAARIQAFNQAHGR